MSLALESTSEVVAAPLMSVVFAAVSRSAGCRGDRGVLVICAIVQPLVSLRRVHRWPTLSGGRNDRRERRATAADALRAAADASAP